VTNGAGGAPHSALRARARWPARVRGVFGDTNAASRAIYGAVGVASVAAAAQLVRGARQSA
jgi:hypothetical protein